DCDLQNPLQNAECGQISNLNFAVPNAPPSLSYDPAILKGWGTRPSDWIIGVTVQHEVFPRMSVSIGYTRRWLQNFTITDNQAVSAADFTPFSIVAPLDPRLPGGGGYTVAGLYDVVPTKAGQINNFSTYASNYGTISQMYDGVDVNVIARLRNGFQFQAGLSSGARVTDYCSVRTALPEMTGGVSTRRAGPGISPANPACPL